MEQLVLDRIESWAGDDIKIEVAKVLGSKLPYINTRRRMAFFDKDGWLLADNSRLPMAADWFVITHSTADSRFLCGFDEKDVLKVYPLPDDYWSEGYREMILIHHFVADRLDWNLSPMNFPRPKEPEALKTLLGKLCWELASKSQSLTKRRRERV